MLAGRFAQSEHVARDARELAREAGPAGASRPRSRDLHAGHGRCLPGRAGPWPGAPRGGCRHGSTGRPPGRPDASRAQPDHLAGPRLAPRRGAGGGHREHPRCRGGWSGRHLRVVPVGQRCRHPVPAGTLGGVRARLPCRHGVAAGRCRVVQSHDVPRSRAGRVARRRRGRPAGRPDAPPAGDRARRRMDGGRPARRGEPRAVAPRLCRRGRRSRSGLGARASDQRARSRSRWLHRPAWRPPRPPPRRVACAATGRSWRLPARWPIGYCPRRSDVLPPARCQPSWAPASRPTCTSTWRVRIATGSAAGPRPRPGRASQTRGWGDRCPTLPPRPTGGRRLRCCRRAAIARWRERRSIGPGDIAVALPAGPLQAELMDLAARARLPLPDGAPGWRIAIRVQSEPVPVGPGRDADELRTAPRQLVAVPIASQPVVPKTSSARPSARACWRHRSRRAPPCTA